MKIISFKKAEYVEIKTESGCRYRRYSDGKWDRVITISGCNEHFRLDSRKVTSLEEAYQEYITKGAKQCG